MTLRRILIAALGALLLIAPAVAAPRAALCSGTGYRAFDFWLGQWRVSDGDGHPVGGGAIAALPDGCGFIERITDAEGTVGTSINVFDPLRGSWSQLWTGPGNVVRLEGRPGGADGIALEGTLALMGPAKEIPLRVVWTRAADGGVRQDFFTRSAPDAAWTKLFARIYTPAG